MTTKGFEVLESKIKSDIRTALERRGWLCVFTMKTNKNGWPDMMALKNGVAIFLETKKEDHQARKLQAYWLEALRKVGFKAAVVDSVHEACHVAREAEEACL